MASIKNAYASAATITCTLTSLANGSARESTVIDNTSNLYQDALLRIQSKGAASGTSVLEIYAYSALSDTTYTDLATGSDAAFTAANIFNSVLIGVVQMNAATSAVTWGPVSIAAAFGGVLPSKWGLIVKNSSGAALSATAGDHVLKYEGVYSTVA